MLKIFTIILTLIMLASCSPAVRNASAAHTVINIQNDRRSFGTIIDDGTLYLDLHNAIAKDKEGVLKDAHLNFSTHNSKVLVTGEVAKQEHKALVNKLITEHVPQILKVINETIVAPSSSLISRANDSLITLKIQALFYSQDVFHPVHISITTENETVFLMGKVTKKEAAEAVRIIKKVSGVKKIVKVFEYLKNRPIAEIRAEEQQRLKAQRKKQFDKQLKQLKKRKATLIEQERLIQDKIDQLDGLKPGGTRF